LIAKIFIETAYAPPASGKSALGLAAKIEAHFFHEASPAKERGAFFGHNFYQNKFFSNAND